LETFKVGDIILGKYEVTRVLGKGGMGVVLAAPCRPSRARPPEPKPSIEAESIE